MEPKSSTKFRQEPTNHFVAFDTDAVERSIPDRFETIVRAYPDNLAVSTEDRPLTYDQLNKLANRIARAILKKRGPGSESIALLFEHGVEAILACLSILKTGKIVVALDLSFPQERLAEMLEDSQAALILTNHENMEIAKRLAQGGRQVITIDYIDGIHDDTNLEIQMTSDTPAQIVYTSGSTGHPKGVVRNHKRLLHNAMVAIRTNDIRANDRSLLLFTLGFGAGITGILIGLLSGAALFPFDSKKRGLNSLAGFIDKAQITLYSSTPSTFRCLIQGVSKGDSLSSVRMVVLSAEPVSRYDVELYRKHFSPKCILVNEFTSSEVGKLCRYNISKETELVDVQFFSNETKSRN